MADRNKEQIETIAARSGAGFGGGSALTFPIDFKETPDALDEEFSDGSFDQAWTAVEGAAGTVVHGGNGAGVALAGIYDLTSRPGQLLLQGDQNQDNQLLLDEPLAIGECWVAKVNVAASLQAGDNSVQCGIAINDADTGAFDGNTAVFFAVESDGINSIDIQVDGFGNYSALGATFTQSASLTRTVYMRIDRPTSDSYAFYFSYEGETWAHLDTLTGLSDVADNLWIFGRQNAALPDEVPIHVFDWVRKGVATALDPWPRA